MRVISGKAKGRKLLCPEGSDTRPSSDYFRELLFDCLQFQIADTCWLDLFSGTGAISIEALSRGAKQAVLVEQNQASLAMIKENLNSTGFLQCAELLPMDVREALVLMANQNRSFDFIFMDPPYNHGFEEYVLLNLSASLIRQGGRLIIESDAQTVFSSEALARWDIIKEKKTRRTKMTFLRLK